MTAGQKSGTGAMTEMKDEKVRKDDILSNRDKSQRAPDPSLDSKGVQVEEYKDVPTNQRPDQTAASESRDGRKSGEADEKTDRPGFDLGGTDHGTRAGKGLGLGTDAKEGKKDWALRK